MFLGFSWSINFQKVTKNFQEKCRAKTLLKCVSLLICASMLYIYIYVCMAYCVLYCPPFDRQSAPTAIEMPVALATATANQLISTLPTAYSAHQLVTANQHTAYCLLAPATTWSLCVFINIDYCLLHIVILFRVKSMFQLI